MNASRTNMAKWKKWGNRKRKERKRKKIHWTIWNLRTKHQQVHEKIFQTKKKKPNAKDERKYEYDNDNTISWKYTNNPQKKNRRFSMFSLCAVCRVLGIHIFSVFVYIYVQCSSPIFPLLPFFSFLFGFSE